MVRRSLASFFLLAAQASPAVAGDAGTVAAIDCADPASGVRINLPNVGPVEVSLTSNQPVWVEIAERGQQLDIATDYQRFGVAIPLRFGRWFVQVPAGKSAFFVHRKRTNQAAGAIDINAHCAPDAAVLWRINWYRSAAAIAADLKAPTAAASLGTNLAAIDALAQDQVDSEVRALATHLRAQALLLAEHYDDSIAAFAKAEAAWFDANDDSRALAARAARIENLVVTGKYAEVLAQVPDALRTTTGSREYFDIRLQNARCAALDSLGRLSQASACYKSATDALRENGELAEYANVSRNAAAALLAVGKVSEAEALARHVIDLATGPGAEMTRGRLHLTLADIAISRGQAGDAFRECNLALDQFNVTGSQRWQANALLKIAQLFLDLGAYDDALLALKQAVPHLTVKDAPTRLAEAIDLFATIERKLGHAESSTWMSYAAERMYASHGMSEQVTNSLLNRLDVRVQANDDYAKAKQTIGGQISALARVNAQRHLLEATIALRQSRFEDAQSELRAARQTALSFRDLIRYWRLESAYEARVNNIASALQVLLQARKYLSKLTTAAGSSALRYALAQQRLPLQKLAFETVLEQKQVDPVELVWPWLDVQDSFDLHRGISVFEDNEAFDKAMATELLATSSQPADNLASVAQRKLLSLLARPAGSSTVASTSSGPVSDLMQSLDSNSVFIAYLDGESRGGVLWVTHDDIRVLDAASPDEIRVSTAALRDALRSPNTPTSHAQAASQALSAELLRGVSPSTPPKRLLVLADEMMPRIAWSTLIWPGQSAPLIETTAIEFVHLTRDDSAHARAQAAHALHLIVASQDQTGSAPLARLANASAEPQLIRAAFSGPAIPFAQPSLQVAEGEQATREAVLSALDEPGAWVHVAAHGTAQPHRIGYAGLWLGPSPPQESRSLNPAAQSVTAVAPTPSAATEANAMPPAFLSWLDILDRGVRADLVVLNACQLGDSGSAINGNLSFADAVSRAGAKQVVAASWPVSDAAAALWVPAFYSALATDPQRNAAVALRAAQLRLRESRAFAHPFFWAGMQTTTRLALSALAEQPSKTDSRGRR